MLKSLQLVFNGQGNQLSAAEGAMFLLGPKATAMMALTPPAGPTFEWREAS